MKTNFSSLVGSKTKRRQSGWLRGWLLIAGVIALTPKVVSANQAGGGNGTGPDVTVVNNNDGTVTMSNGIASITIDTKYARLSSIKYTYNNNGTTQTTETLDSLTTPGREDYAFGGSPLGNLNDCVYSLATDPTTNGGAYADVQLISNTTANGIFEADYSMFRGSPGFYVTAINTRRSTDTVASFGNFGINANVTTPFNWLSADSARNYYVGGVRSTLPGFSVKGATHEMIIRADGSEVGQYDSKFIPAQDRADEKAWGWSSVGSGGLNIGVWTMTNLEYGDGGPLKRDDGVSPGSSINNQIMTGEFSMGHDGDFNSTESWTKTAGPWFIYLNNVSSSITDPNQAAQALYNDALAQATAETNAWPYQWFVNPNYTLSAGRGTVTGSINVSDPVGNANPAVNGTWVGLEAQPNTADGVYDYQEWSKTYQYWTQTNSGGGFTFKNVLPGSNYTLYAYGPGIAGTFMSQHQTAMPGPGTADPPLEVDVPSSPFAVSVSANSTTNLGNITWSAQRVGKTVFEIGYPDRKADKFRHGEDFWAAQLPPQVGYPTGIWGGEMNFFWEFPNYTVNYTVGQSQWQTDWNYVLPSQLKLDGSGYADATGIISFNLAQAPGGDGQASLYIGCASDFGGKVIVMVNSTALDSSVDGITAEPNPISSAGFNPPNPTGASKPNYADDSSVHSSDHGPFFDERITFPASLLQAGTNTITIVNDSKVYSGQLMTDYIRLELTDYAPPPPSGVTAYPGDNKVLVTWPVVPGATRYCVLRSTVSGSGFVALPAATGVLGTVCGSGPRLMNFTDTTATNGTNYYYEVKSLNPGFSSAASTQSGRSTPESTISDDPPAAPSGLAVSATGNHSVSLSWTAGTDVNYCNIYRTTLHPNGVGGTYPLRTIMLRDGNTGRSQNYSWVDSTPTNGTTYSYYVIAVSPAGTSSASSSVTATPLPPLPSNPPQGLTSTRSGTTVTLNWTQVPNATAYAIYRSTTSGGPFTFPGNFVASYPLTQNFQDTTTVAGTTYYYQVTAVNVAGISAPASITVGP